MTVTERMTDSGGYLDGSFWQALVALVTLVALLIVIRADHTNIS